MAYDVFISFKNTAPGGGLTVDRAIAERLHTRLRDEGLNVFFSEKDLSTAAFMDEIYQALDEADLLILVGTSVDYINSRWVKSEWSTFFGSIQSGRKPNGSIITVLQNISTRDIPIQLEHFESFDARNLDGAVDFAFKTLGKVKKSEAAAWLAQEEERKRKEAEEAALMEAQKRLEAERQAEKEKAAAEKRRQKALAAAERERQKRLSAEKKAAEAQKRSEQQAGQNKALKIVAAVLCAVVVIGGVIAVSTYVEQQREIARIDAEQRQALIEQQAEKLRQDATPKTEADRLLDEIYDFEWAGDGFAITGYSGEGGDVVLPGEYNGEKVVEIGCRSFSQCNSLNSATIPDGVTSIDEYAFFHCPELSFVTIPDSVISIGRGAFAACVSLSSISIPDGVTNIAEDTFNHCTSLTSVSLPDSVTSIGVCAFNHCSSLTSVTLPDGVTNIGNNAFEQCSSLTSVSIPDSATSIGDGAFAYCSSLSSADITDNVTRIEFGMFAYCSSLTSVSIPDNVTIIAGSAFEGCSSLTSVTIPDNVTIIADSAFEGCSSLTSVTIPDSVTRIGASSFAYCSKLSSISIPNSVTNIGNDAFEGYKITVTAPNKISYYGDGDIYKLRLGSTVTWIVEE